MGLGKFLKNAFKPPKAIRNAVKTIASKVSGLGAVVGAVTSLVPGVGPIVGAAIKKGTDLLGKAAGVVKKGSSVVSGVTTAVGGFLGGYAGGAAAAEGDDLVVPKPAALAGSAGILVLGGLAVFLMFTMFGKKGI